MGKCYCDDIPPVRAGARIIITAPDREKDSFHERLADLEERVRALEACYKPGEHNK